MVQVAVRVTAQYRRILSSQPKASRPPVIDRPSQVACAGDRLNEITRLRTRGGDSARCAAEATSSSGNTRSPMQIASAPKKFRSVGPIHNQESTDGGADRERVKVSMRWTLKTPPGVLQTVVFNHDCCLSLVDSLVRLNKHSA